MNRNAYQLELPAGHVTTCVNVLIKDLQIWFKVFNINDVDLFAMEVIFLHVKLFIKANISPLDLISSYTYILTIGFSWRTSTLITYRFYHIYDINTEYSKILDYLYKKLFKWISMY